MSTLTLTIILTLKQQSLNIRQTLAPAPPRTRPRPRPRVLVIPSFYRTNCAKTCTVQVFTRVRVTVEPFLSGQVAHLAAGPM